MRKHFWAISIIVIIGLFAIRSIFHSGFTYSHDSLWHVERIANMYSLLPTQFPVRWSPSLDNGYGVPLFNFTYPLPYYLGAAFMYLGLGPIKAYDLIIVIFYLLGGLGVYFLAQKNTWVGLGAAIIYLMMPYQFLDIFVRGAFGEVVAMGLIPWALLSYERISTSGRLRAVSPVPLALLLLAHNFYGYLFVGLIIYFIIFRYQNKKTQLISLFLSLMLASFFLVPAFLEKGLLLYSQVSHSSYKEHFVYPSQLLYSPWSYLGSQAGLDPQEMSFQLGVPSIVVLALAILSLFLFRSKKVISSIIACIAAIFMMLPSSDFLWQAIPLLPSIQYPWRLLGVVAILVPFIFIELLTQSKIVRYKKYFPAFIIFLVAIALYTTRNYLRPAYWMDSEQFLKYHYEYVGKTTTAGRDEIVPYWAPYERYNAGQTPSLSFTYSSEQDGSLTVERNYFPTWAGTMDGQKIVLAPTQTGEIMVPVAAGQHSYLLYQKSTYIQIIGNTLSLVALFLIFAISIKGKKANN